MRRKWWTLLVALTGLAGLLVGPAGASHSCPEVWADGTYVCKRDVPTAYGTEATVALSGLAADEAETAMWAVTDDNGGSSTWYPKLVKLMRDSSDHVYVAATYRFYIDTPSGPYYYPGNVLDPEDVALAPDGTLWVPDEKHLWLLHVDKTGKVLDAVVDPAGYGPYKTNRGFEGLTVGPMRTDAKNRQYYTVFAMLQGPVRTESDQNLIRMVAFDVVVSDFDPIEVEPKQYRYRLDDPASYNLPAGAWIGQSGLAYHAGTNQILVIERDNLGGVDARMKRIYAIDDPTLQAAPPDPLPKTLYKDLFAYGWTFEKLEGITVTNTGTGKHFTVINDNDGSSAEGSQQTWDFDEN